MSKELVTALMENDESADRLLEAEVQAQIQQVYNEGAFTRTLATIAGAVGAGWGAAKLTGNWLAQNGVPDAVTDFFSGYSNSTIGGALWTRAFESMNFVSDKVNTINPFTAQTGAADLSADVLKKAIFSGNASLEMLAAGANFYMPTILTTAAGLVGGTVFAFGMRQLFKLSPSVKSRYKSLQQAVKARDDLYKKMGRIDSQEGQSDAMKRLLKQADKQTKQIIKEARALEKAVAKNIDSLEEDQVETISSFIDMAKNGMVSDLQKGGAA